MKSRIEVIGQNGNDGQHYMAHLSPMLREIAEKTDYNTAITLANTYGGQRVYIPTLERLRPEHPLARSVGFENAQALASLYGLTTVEIPMARTVSKAYRDREIYRQHLNGSTVTELARSHDLSARTVLRIMQKQAIERGSRP